MLLLFIAILLINIIFAIFSVIVLFGKPFIELLVGDKFADVYYIVICLTFAHLLGNTLQIAVDKVYADNKIKHLSLITFMTSFIGIVFSCIFANQFGAVGCAICSGTALLFTQVGYLFVYKKRVNLNICLFFCKCHLRILPTLILTSILYYLLLRFFYIHTYSELIISVLGYCIIYIFISYKYLFNDYEKVLVKNIIYLVH